MCSVCEELKTMKDRINLLEVENEEQTRLLVELATGVNTQ